MPHTERTALLDQNWDLQLTPEGNIKLASGPLATAQNCANEIRLWRDDAYFQTENGIAWKEAQLGRKMDENILTNVIREACMKVPNVAIVENVTVSGLDNENRVLSGSIEIQTIEGENVSFNF